MRNEDEFKYLKPTNPLLTKGSEGGFIPQVAMLRHARDGERSRTIRNPQSNGFTLIEIIITIVVTSIIAGLSAVIILQGVRSYSDEDTRSDLHYQTRLAVERMAREIRMVNSQGNV